MAKQDSRLDGGAVQGGRLIVTRDLLDRIRHKNKRAAKRMARRFMRKVSAAISLTTKYSPLELELNQLGRLRDGVTPKVRARIEADVARMTHEDLSAYFLQFKRETHG